MVWFVVGFLAGAVIGAGVALVAANARGRAAQRQMRETFAALAGEALDANAKRLGEATAAQLDGKKQLIDQSIKAANDRLEQVRRFLQRIEAERKQDFGKLSQSVASLSTTTGELHRMLASSQRRGAWGERMAEDVLRLVGMVEGVNYAKQDERYATTGRPDFTFFLPNDLKCNMDVKFPLEHYKAYVDADGESARGRAAGELVAAVRRYIRDVSGRGYVDAAIPTVNYVIVFVPSEQLYAVVLASEPDLIDEALGRGVVLASPLTLYAMLAVVRQAAESANVMRTADEVLDLLGQFESQWQRYKEEQDKLGNQLETVRRTYDALRTTRTNTLEKPLVKIDELRQRRLSGRDESPDNAPG
ncbi:MAG: DNA recombination protein RmuC [Phycisphaerae bacterium]|nr:DNA recombination protein RmuC [Phycisphaerae bacterium]